MASGRVLCESYSMRPSKALETTSRCVGLLCLGDGCFVWMLPDEGRVQCYDPEADTFDWTVDDCGAPHAAVFVDLGKDERVCVLDREGGRLIWIAADIGSRMGEMPPLEPEHHDDFDDEPWDPSKFVWAEKPLSSPHGLTVWQDRPRGDDESDESEESAHPIQIWVADTGNNRLVGFCATTGVALDAFGEDLLDGPRGVAALGHDRLASVCRRGGHVFGRGGELLYRFNFHLMLPTSILFDSRGESGLLVVVDEYTDRILMFCARTGQHLRTVSDTGLCMGTDVQRGLAFADTADGCRLYIADDRHRRICFFEAGKQDTPAPLPDLDADFFKPMPAAGGRRKSRKSRGSVF